MGIQVVLVSPKYQINLGYVARVSKNFGISKIVLVNPRCKPTGIQAIKYSKHAVDLLKNARISRSLSEATSGTFVIGTTGIWHKSEKAFYNIFPMDEFLKRFQKRLKSRPVSLVIGRDDTGLTKEEMRMCDASVFIRTDPAYTVLNISHALAIALYELTKGRFDYGKIDTRIASSSDRDELVRLFSIDVRSNNKIRDKSSVIMAFRHIINRAVPTSKELSAVAIGLNKNKKEK